MPLDEQLLPNPSLKPWYDRVTWLFVSRNFKLDDKDREALRTHDRFGISSWPQMIVFDPRTDAVLLDAPRDLAGFLRAFERSVGGMQRRGTDSAPSSRPLVRDLVDRDARPFAVRLRDPNPVARAVALEDLALANEVPRELVSEASALLAKQDEDVVVVIRALRLLAKREPALVLARTKELLAVDNDPLRYEVLQLVAAQPDPALEAVLAHAFAEAGKGVPSRNPNVLRMRIAPCLGAVGSTAAIEAMTPLARAAEWRNGTTKFVLDALRAIALRVPAQKGRIAALLLECFPRAVPASDPAETRGALHLAEVVASTLAALRPDSKAPPLPKAWSEAERATYLADWR